MLLIQSLTSALVFNYIQHLSESRWTWWFVSILTYTNVNALWRMKSCIMVPYLWKVRRLIYQFFLSEKHKVNRPWMKRISVCHSIFLKEKCFWCVFLFLKTLNTEVCDHSIFFLYFFFFSRYFSIGTVSNGLFHIIKERLG